MKRGAQAGNSSTQQSARPVHSPYLSSQEAVIYLRLPSTASLYALIREQRLPNLRRGRLYLFDTRDLDAWLCGETVGRRALRSA